MSDLNIPASLLPCFPVLGKHREANREAELRENAFIFSLKQGSREAGKRLFSKQMLGISQEATMFQKHVHDPAIPKGEDHGND